MASRHQGNIVWSSPQNAGHDDILDAIEDRDAPLAKQRMRNHIALFVRNQAPDIFAIIFENDPQGEPQMTPKTV